MSAIIADNLLDLNGSGNVGDTITTAILNSGTQGTNAGWTATASVSSLKLAASGNDRLDQVILRGSGTAFATGATHRKITYDHVNASQWVTLAAPTGMSPAGSSVCGWFTFGAADAGLSGVFFDYIGLLNASGDYAIMQHKNGNGAGGAGYCVGLHTNPGGVSQTVGAGGGAPFTITQGSRHFFSLQMNSVAATAQLDLYDTAGVLETSITASTNNHGTAMSSSRVGNAETGTSTGLAVIEDLAWDWLGGAAPLGPVGPSFYYIPIYGVGVAGTSTSATSTTTDALSVVAGDLVFVGSTYEGTAAAGHTCADSNSVALTSIGTTDNSGTNGEPHVSAFWIKAPTTGSLTYTVSYGGSSKAFRNVPWLILRPSAALGTVAADGTPAGASATTGTAYASGNTTTTSTHGVAIAVYPDFGASLTLPRINGVLPIARSQSNTANSLIFLIAYTTGFTGQATGTLSGSNHWTARLAGIDAPLATGTITIDMWGAVQTTPMARRLRGVVPSGTVGIKA